MRRGIIWYSDFVIGLTIFLIALTTAIFYIRNPYMLTRDSAKEANFAASYFSQSLIGPGVPDNWNDTNAIKIGITGNDNVINVSKLESLRRMTGDMASYYTTKSYFGSGYDFLIYFTDKDGNVLNITSTKYYGMPGVDDTSILTLNSDEIVTVTRYLVLKREAAGQKDSRIVRMVLHIWK